MVITVSCPSCSKSFPVDSAKVPPKGVNARCSSCGDVFRVEKPKEAVAETARTGAPAASAAASRAPAPPLPPPPPVEDDSSDLHGIEVVPSPAPPVAAQPKPMTSPTPPGKTAPDSAPSATSGAAPPAGGTFRFGKRDPTDKAKRLARVLVSDMIMYNAERHRNALENDTLAADFEDEIEKSWKEYREQVGADVADGEGTQFWRDALNDILAKGEKVF
jgi:predicted Zn finger-like uncharacterized protein